MVATHRTHSLTLAALTCATWLPACCFGPPAPTPAEQPAPLRDEDNVALQSFLQRQATPLAPYAPPADVMERVGISEALRVAAEVTPMRPNAATLFDRARPHSGPIERGLLICRVGIQGHFDDSFFAGGADVFLSFRVGERPWRATPQASSRVFTMPLSDVAVGASLEFNVVDQDLIFHDHVASVQTPYTASPFALEAEHATLQCRVMADVSREAEQAIARYVRTLDSFENTGVPAPDLRDANLGFGSTEHVLASAGEAASWVGWDAPEMDAARARAGAIDGAFEYAVGEAVVSVAPTLPAFGERVELRDRSLRVVRLACGDEADAMRRAMGSGPVAGTSYCRAIFEITAKSRLTLGAIRGIDAPEMWALQTTGARDRVQRIAIHQGDDWVRPDRPVTLGRNETCEVHIGFSRPAPLLRLGTELAGTPTLVRLE